MYKALSDKKKGRKVTITLITGCAGFIGTNLALALLEKGHYVIGMDNFITGHKNNIRVLTSKFPSKFNFIEHNIIEPLKWFDFIPIDEIYHLASIASPEFYFRYPMETIMVNTVGTKNMLDLTRVHNCKILFTSTSEVYGDPKVHPQPETYYGNVNSYGPRSCYDESKRLGETIVYEYRRMYDVNTKIVRIFNTYGPYMNLNDKRVVIEFIKNALNGDPLLIHGNGYQTRSFCYIDDLVSGLILMMESEEEGPINLGNDCYEEDVVTLASMVIELTSSFVPKISTIAHDLAWKDDPQCRKPDLSQARYKLKYEPKVSLKEGIQKTVEYVREELN